MILQAGYDCYLTQAEDMPLSERRFENQVLVNSPEDVSYWKEITSREKEQIIADAAFIDLASIDINALERVNLLLDNIADKINNSHLTASESLRMKDFYPTLDNIVNTDIRAGFRFVNEGVLCEAIVDHHVSLIMTLDLDQEPWYKIVVSEEDTIVLPIENADKL